MSEQLPLASLANCVATKVSPRHKNELLPYVGLEHLTTDVPRVTRTALASSSIGINSVFDKADTLFGKLRPNLRKVARTDFSGYCSTDILVLRARPGVDSSYLSHVLRSEGVLGFAAATAFGTKMPRTSWSLISSQKVFAPSVSVQQQVAEVLDAVDEEIMLTEATIDKLEAISYGMLLDLMSGGLHRARSAGPGPTISVHGQQIGLPPGWELKPIGELLGVGQPAMRSGPFGSALLKRELVNEGVPLLGIDNVHVNRFDANFDRFVTESKARDLARYLVRPNDVMITIMGTVGRSCLVPPKLGPALSSKHVWTLTIDPSKYSPYLVSRQLNHAPWARKQLRRDEQGGVMNAIRSETLRSLLLPVPPLADQHRIEDALRAMDDKIQTHSNALSKVQLLRKGLRADLVSGLVRVPDGAFG